MTETGTVDAPAEPGPATTRVARARAAAEARIGRVHASRAQHRSVEMAFGCLARDKQIAGGVLGGGLAYRFFFWTLAFSLLFSGALGFASRAHLDIEPGLADAGLTGAVGSTITDAAEQAETGRWWLVLVGSWLVLWFSWSLLRALRLVHAAAWQVEVTPPKHVVRAVAAVVAAPFLVVLLTAMAGWTREKLGFLPGLVVTLAWAAAFGAVWLRVSSRLPRQPTPWRALLPGAILVAAGVEALHLFTVYFLAEKLASSSALYGALGIAGTMLFYLFLVGRLVVWAAELNSVAWETRPGAAHPGENVRGVMQAHPRARDDRPT